MTTEPETRTTARLLARGFNRHILDHGPDGDYAGEPVETSDGHGFIVSRGGAPFAVRVERSPLGADGPLTPGQCWAALKTYLADAAPEVTSEMSDAEIKIRMSVAAAYRHALDKMRELEG